MAEMYGKQEGCSGGFGGSMHLYDVSVGATSAPTPSSAVACRAWRAPRSRSSCAARQRVAVPFFGDGATNTGAFHETMNLAQLWKLPVVFVLENNGWAESTPATQQLPLKVEEMAQRAPRTA